MYLSDKINQSKCSRVLEEYFNSSTELYEIMVVECMEYMIDLSINELTVHWCGHSELELAQQPYEQFEEDFLKYNHCFMDHLISLYDGDKAMLRNLLQDQVEFLERIAVKPTTLKKIIANTNQTYHLLLEDQPLFMDFQTKDRQLKYFNEKAFILESIDQS